MATCPAGTTDEDPYHLRCPGWRPRDLSQHARSRPARTRAGGTTSLGRGQINLTDLSKTGFSSARQCRKLSKGHSVSVGRIGKLECDFFARRDDSYAHVQVSMTIASPEVERREHTPFGRIRDGWPRFLSTFDPLRSQRDEVRHLKPHGVPQDGLEPLLMSPQSPRMYSYAIEGKPQYRSSSLGR